MNITERRLLMLVLDNDRCPSEEWLGGIRDKPTRARIERQIDKLSRDLGVQRGLQGIAELKIDFIDFGPGYRVYYGFLDQKTVVVLIGGGDKSSQTRDIADARQLWANFVKSGASERALRVWKEEQEAGEEGKEEADEAEKF